jgi:hypothetical protein
MSVSDSESWDQIAVFRLRDEFGKNTDIVQCSFRVCETHISYEEANLTESERSSLAAMDFEQEGFETRL